MSIGSKIRKYRKQQGLTQKELAKLSGLNEVTIRSYEADKYKPKQENLKKLANALGVYIGELDADWSKNINLENIDFREFALELSDLNNAISRKYEYKKKTLLNTLDANGIIYVQDIQEQKIISDFRELNSNGKMEALKRIEELTEIPKYQKDAIDLMAGTKAVMAKVPIEENVTFEMITDDDKKKED